MNLLKHIQKHQTFYALLLVAALARLIFLFDFHEIWWDAGVYHGMAKYLWSAGSAGLWEHIRPVLWPAILGAAWQLNANMVWFARILEFVLALVSTGLVYMLGRKLFSQRAAILSSVIWTFSSIVFYLGFHSYNEIPAITLVLAALTAFVYNRWFLAGFLTGLAFLTKFPAGIFIVVLGIVLLSQKRWKTCIPLGIGFVIPAGAFLLFNQWMYGAALGPLIDARSAILNVLGCNVLRFKPWWQYFSWIVTDNWLNVFAIVGIAAVAKQWKKYLLPLLALILPLLYFMQLHCREYRYLVLFLPFVVLFSGHGLALITDWLQKWDKKQAWTVVLLVVLGSSIAHSMWFYQNNESRTPDIAAEQYYHWLQDKQIKGEIWSSNPTVSVYTDQKVNKIYYPVFEKHTATDFLTYLTRNPDRIGAVLLDNCGGGIICPPDDAKCEESLESTRSVLNEKFSQVFNAWSGACWYEIYINA